MKPPTCAGCPLEQAGTGFVVPRSAPAGAPLIVIESPDLHDIKVGQPGQVTGETGAILEQALRLAGLRAEQFGWYSLIACKPPQPLKDQAYQFTAPAHCVDHHLAVVIRESRPSVIIACGPQVAQILTGLSGQSLTIDMIRGYALHGVGAAKGFPVLPVSSPIYIQQGNWHDMTLLVRDLKKATKIKSVPELDSSEYMMHASPVSVKRFLGIMLAHPEYLLSYDFEWITAPGYEDKAKSFSSEKLITQVNLALYNGDEWTVLVADYNHETKELLHDILGKTENPKVGYNNWHADDKVARFNGFEIKGSRIDDAMFCINFLYPDLPARRTDDREDLFTAEDGGLMPLQVAASLYDWPQPWKHLSGLDPHLYGAIDAHSTGVVFLGAANELITSYL